MARARSSKKNNSSANLFFESRDRRIWLAAELNAQFAESHRLEESIRANLKGLGFK